MLHDLFSNSEMAIGENVGDLNLFLDAVGEAFGDVVVDIGPRVCSVLWREGLKSHALLDV